MTYILEAEVLFALREVSLVGVELGRRLPLLASLVTLHTHTNEHITQSNLTESLPPPIEGARWLQNASIWEG